MRCHTGVIPPCVFLSRGNNCGGEKAPCDEEAISARLHRTGYPHGDRSHVIWFQISDKEDLELTFSAQRKPTVIVHKPSTTTRIHWTPHSVMTSGSTHDYHGLQDWGEVHNHENDQKELSPNSWSRPEFAKLLWHEIWSCHTQGHFQTHNLSTWESLIPDPGVVNIPPWSNIHIQEEYIFFTVHWLKMQNPQYSAFSPPISLYWRGSMFELGKAAEVISPDMFQFYFLKYFCLVLFCF